MKNKKKGLDKHEVRELELTLKLLEFLIGVAAMIIERLLSK